MHGSRLLVSASGLLVASCLALPAVAPATDHGQGEAFSSAEELAAEASTAEPPHIQSEAVKAFRKQALSVDYSSDGLTLHGWIYRPVGNGPFPAILWNHGGEKMPGAHSELGMFYTRHGYVLFVPIRHGHGSCPGQYLGDAMSDYAATGADRDSIQKKAVELQELYNQDVVAALAWLKKQSYVKPGAIAISGVSFGGVQTLLTAEKGLDVRAFIPFAPGAAAWSNPELRKLEIRAAQAAKAPLFLLQAQNDFGLGPSEILGPMIRQKGGLNQAKIYPPFGTTRVQGNFGFACWEEGVAVWGNDVAQFLKAVGMGGN
jgi:carboxymethylenebutenolidase